MSITIRPPGAGHHERGTATMEFALFGSFLVFLLLVTFDFGRIFYTAIGVTSAASGLALHGFRNSTSANLLPLDMTGAAAKTKAKLLSPDVTFTTVTATLQCKCPNATAYTACPSPLPTCTGLYIAIQATASATFNTLITYPGIPKTTPITRSALIRVQ